MPRRADDPPPDAETRAVAALAGARIPPAATLLDLVHAVNPTGRALSEAVAARRYSLKNRLQSLLVRHYADELRIQPQPGGVVALDHRFSGRDACHARVDDLDEDARALVRFRLDTQEAAESVPASRRPRRDAPEGDPLALGEAALAAWDFDTARARFEEALARSGGAARPALALAELLVDRLALDADALALAPSLGPEALACVPLRARLALAAARTGDADAAREWLSGVRGPPAADAHAELVRLSLAQGDEDGAAAALDALREADGAHADVLSLAEELSRRRAARRRPLEEALERARAERAPDLERRARELLARHPDSEVARRVLRALEEDGRRGRLADLRRRAEEALERGSDEARALLAQARSLAPGDTELQALAARAEEEARARASSRRIAAVHAALSGPEPAAGLAEWMALAPDERALVRARCGRDDLGWVEALGVPGPGSKQRALVEAVRALFAARKAFEAGEPAEASRLLATPRTLELGPARELRALVDAELHRRAVDANARRLADALDRMAGLDPAAGQIPEMPRDVDPDLLTAPMRATWDQLAERVRRAREVSEPFYRAKAAVLSNRFIEARLLLQTVPGAGEREAVRELDDAAKLGLRRSWQVESHGPRGELATAGHRFCALPGRTLPLREFALDEDGRLLLADCVGQGMLLQEIDPVARRVTRLTRMQLPTALWKPHHCVAEGLLWLTDINGQGFAIETADPLPARSFPASDRQILTADIPDGRHFWRTCLDGNPAVCEVRDAADWRRLRTFDGVAMAVAVPGPEPAVAIAGDERTQLVAGDGTPLPPFVVSAGRVRIVAHPSGPGRVCVRRRGKEGCAGTFELHALDAAGEGPTLLELPARNSWDVVASREAELLFLLDRARGGLARLAALEPDAGRWRVRWRRELPDHSVLVGDRLARRAVLLWDASRGLGMAPLGADPPEIPDEELRAFESVLPPILDARGGSCGMPDVRRVRKAALKAGREAGHDVRRLVRRLTLELGACSGDELEFALEALGLAVGGDVRSGLGLAGEGPSEATKHLWFAHQEAAEGHWQDAADWLAQTEHPENGPPLDGAKRLHAAHLRGLVLVRAGRWGEARTCWAQAAEGEPPNSECRLGTALEWLDAVRSPPGTPGRGRFGRLTAAMVAYDAARAAGDAQAALRAVDVPEVLHGNERQSSARLAEALLEQPPGLGAAGLWHGHLLRRAFGTLAGLGIEVWLPGAWPAERLLDMRDRIRRRGEEEMARWDRAFCAANGIPPAAGP